MRWSILIFSSGCEFLDGVTDDTGTAPDASASGFRWYDANGEQVTVGEDLVIFDDDGFVWGIDEDSTFIADMQFISGDIYYEQPGCMGDPWVGARTAVDPFVPRYSTQFAPEDPNLGANLSVVRPDALFAEPFVLASFFRNLVCTDMPPDYYVFADEFFRFHDLIQATKPIAWWTPPLHPELIE